MGTNGLICAPAASGTLGSIDGIVLPEALRALLANLVKKTKPSLYPGYRRGQAAYLRLW